MSYPAPSSAESDVALSPVENYAAPTPTENSPERPTVETPPITKTAEIYPASIPGEVNRSLEIAWLHRARHLPRLWRRARFQAVAVLTAVIVGCGFGYVVAWNDRPMQIYLSAAVAIGLSLVFSACATELNRNRHRSHD